MIQNLDFRKQVDNVVNKSLHQEEQNKFSQKLSQVGIEPKTS